ncbi:MAG: S1 RNA-binding domain-containing protein [Candidatus Staskawiczbacteria bacterium]|nr:S1 RNA-binding domain-containing protein [Candidatus Staskawiczbacteria bacterium]
MTIKEKIKDEPVLLTIGSTIEGVVVARDRSSLFVDLGAFGTGIIFGREFYEVKDVIKNLKIGDKIYAKIVELENEEGYKELSLKDATKDISWQKLREMKDEGTILKVKITGVNKGGLLTSLDNIPAFLPVSQLSPENYPRVIDADKQKILKELQKFIGKTLEVKVLDLMAQENKLILSEKAKTEEKTKEILKDYKKGDIIEGEITGIADFGVFIRFPLSNEPSEKVKSDIEGLIHISELDWQLVENPAEVIKVGEIVKAQIININNNQVFLSLKSLKKNPWEEIEKKYKKGDIIKGKVIKFSSFGAFIEILPKIRGLCHVSEFGSQKNMEESLEIDKNYDFQVLLIEPKEHRMSLKLVEKK